MFINPVERTVDALIYVQLFTILTRLGMVVLIIFWRLAQIDEHEEAVAGVDNGVDEVAEDGDEVVDLLYLLPLQIEECLPHHCNYSQYHQYRYREHHHLREWVFDQVSPAAFDELPEDGDVLPVERVDVGGELVEVHLDLCRRLSACVFQFQSKVKAILVRPHALGHLLVDEEQ